jgi:FMNH2-dependent dimethyl sulfone monooxygenase
MVAAHPGVMTPQTVAKMGASIDRLSEGRFAVNVVNGWWPAEMNLFGNGSWIEDPDERSARMGEFIRVLRGLWTQESLSFKGHYFETENGQLPIRPRNADGPRIYAASRAPSGKELVAETCDVWFAEYAPDYRLYAQNLEAIRRDVEDMRDRAARYGRTLDYGLSGHVTCADTMEQALERAHELEAYGQRDRIALVAAKALGAGFVGTPELIASRIDDYSRAGINVLMLRFHPMEEGLDTFIETVMPLLRRNVELVSRPMREPALAI